LAKTKLNRVIRGATPAEQRRHKGIRKEVDLEPSARRKPVSASRVILAKL
jgi:hypothetical protein